MNKFNELYESILNEVFNTKLNAKKVDGVKRKWHRYEVELKDIEYTIYPHMVFSYKSEGMWETEEVTGSRVITKYTPKFDIWTAFDIINNVDIMKIPEYLKNGSESENYEFVRNIKDKFNITDIGNATINMIEQFLIDENPEHLKMNIRDIGGNNDLLKLFKKVATKNGAKLKKLGYQIEFDKNVLNIIKEI